jgi:hypothetical protein
MLPVSLAPPVLAPRGLRTTLLCLVLFFGAVGPAWGPGRHGAPPRAHGPAKPRAIVAAQRAAHPAPHRPHVEAALAQRSVADFELRPSATDLGPAIPSAAPGAPATAQKLLDALAGPSPVPTVPVEREPQTAIPPITLVTVPDTPTPSDTADFPGLPGLPGPGSVGGFPGVVGPLPPPGPSVVTPVTPPDQPPLTPPDTPPGQPPLAPPDQPPSLPPVTPPEQPPGDPTPLFPPLTPPDGPPGAPPGGPPPGVPEPTTWALLMGGFFALGAALRLRRARPETPMAINR